MRVKTYEEIKREQAAIKEKKKKAIKDILTLESLVHASFWRRLLAMV